MNKCFSLPVRIKYKNRYKEQMNKKIPAPYILSIYPNLKK